MLRTCSRLIFEKLKADLDDGKLVLVRHDKHVDVAPPTAPVVDTLTVDQLLDQFITRHVALSPRERSMANALTSRRVIERTLIELPTGERRQFGAWLVRDVTSDAIDKLKGALTQQTSIRKKDADGRERTRRLGGVIAANRHLSFLRVALNWGIKKRVLDFLDENPFHYKGTIAVTLHNESDRRRRRRLEGNEAERLLAECDPPRRNPKTKQVMKDQPAPRLRPIGVVLQLFVGIAGRNASSDHSVAVPI